VSKLSPRAAQLLRAAAIYFSVVLAVLALSVVRARIISRQQSQCTATTADRQTIFLADHEPHFCAL